MGTVGMVSLDAIRWCSRVGTPMVVLGADGAHLAVGPHGRDDARLLRAQALALYNPVGVEVTRFLLAEKLKGRPKPRAHFGDDESASTIDDLCQRMKGVDTVEGLRQLEAAGANVHFASFERHVDVVFSRKDAWQVPSPHWHRFNGRRSAINPGSPRSATDVAGAAMNYALKLAEIEAAMATRVMGMDPGLGILHADDRRATFVRL